MKALVIASLLFFGLRAMSAEVGEDQKGECPYSSQTSKREAKVAAAPEVEIKQQEEAKNVSK